MLNDLNNIEKYLSKFRVKNPDASVRVKVLSKGRSAWETSPIHTMQNMLWLKWAIAAVLLIMANVVDNSLTSRLLVNKSTGENNQSVSDDFAFLQEINGIDACRYARLARSAQVKRREIERGKWLKDRLNEYDGRSVL